MPACRYMLFLLCDLMIQKGRQKFKNKNCDSSCPLFRSYHLTHIHTRCETIINHGSYGVMCVVLAARVTQQKIRGENASDTRAWDRTA